jgi:GH15 family glucan-1,4-alpha-glucosidase
MALHAAEDKTFRGGSVASFGTPWGDFVNGDQPNDGYHRVRGRDLYQQAVGQIAAGDSGQALCMAQFLWNSQFVRTATSGDGTTYRPGSFPRYTPVSGISAATAKDLGCCEQLDEEAFAILPAWMMSLADSSTYQKIKMTVDHIVGVGPATTERWEEQFGQSRSSIAAIIAGLVAAADIARQNGDPASAVRWEATADSWRSSLASRTYTTDGYWGDHRYFERIDPTDDPNGLQKIHFDEGDFLTHDVTDFGFLDLVRLGVVAPDDSNVSSSLLPSASASDGNSAVQVTMPNGDIYFHRYNHDNYGESNNDCSGWPAAGYNLDTPSVVKAKYRGAGPIRAAAGECVDDAGARTDNGTAIQIFACNGTAAQNWVWNSGDGTLRALNKCLDVTGGATASGTPLQFWDCNGTGAQEWRWRQQNRLTNPQSGRCLEVAADGTRLQISDCDNTSGQLWRLP